MVDVMVIHYEAELSKCEFENLMLLIYFLISFIFMFSNIWNQFLIW